MSTKDTDLSEFIEYSSRGGDLSTQILKGHLLVEKTVTELFITQLPHSKSLYGKGGASLNFHQIICLAEAITARSQEIPWIWLASKRLNKIRNSLTYQLSPNWLEENVGDLITLVKNENPELEAVAAEKNLSMGDNLSMVVLAMCFCLSSLKPAAE